MPLDYQNYGQGDVFRSIVIKEIGSSERNQVFCLLLLTNRSDSYLYNLDVLGYISMQYFFKTKLDSFKFFHHEGFPLTNFRNLLYILQMFGKIAVIQWYNLILHLFYVRSVWLCACLDFRLGSCYRTPKEGRSQSALNKILPFCYKIIINEKICCCNIS